MIKREKKIIVLMCLILMFQSVVFAAPSEWAADIVESSKEDNLVPKELQSYYQNEVKRYEYVLLALKVLEQNNVDVVITENNPFIDILGHEYEQEIIRAFNANLIGGYEDNTFRPNNEIRREEIAALVYNLVKKLNPNSEIPTIDAEYADQDQISSWARGYVEFCYKNKIISGTGKVEGLDTIDPIGKATREQAIILLYKVSVDKKILAIKEYNPIEVIDGVGNLIKTSEDINITASHVGYDAIDVAIEIVTKSEVSFSELQNNFFTLEYISKSTIIVLDSKYEKDVNLHLIDLDDIDAQNDYLKVLDSIYSNHIFKLIFSKIIENFKIDENYVLNNRLSDEGVISAYSEVVDGCHYYFIKYKRDK